MFVLFTDFGYDGPYVGQMKVVLVRQAPTLPVVDLMHDAPACKPKASAYLLASLTAGLPENAIVVGVVDPGVGDPDRRPVILQADGRCYVGPDNGLFELVARRARDTAWWEISWRPGHLSASFHGRDLFAPAAAKIATEGMSWTGIRPASPVLQTDWPDDLAEIIYIDHFGNAVTGMRAASLDTSAQLQINARRIAYAPTFSAVPQGQVFWYTNSCGLVEIAANGDRADSLLGLAVSDTLQLSSR